MKRTVLILPGIGNSGPTHWQTLWQAARPEYRRVLQADWDHPMRGVWTETLELAVQAAQPRPFLVAHSLACLVVSHWASLTRQAVGGALLVAVPDPRGPSFPTEAEGFGDLELQRLPFPSIVVSSSNDPYAMPEHAIRCSSAWGSRLVEIGQYGHINSSSGLGEWPEGQALLESLMGVRKE